jgi:hypothetical protein
MTEDNNKPTESKFKIHISRSVRHILIAVGALLVLMLLSGSLYTWYLDRQDNKNINNTTAVANNITAAQPIQPVQPAANEPEGVSIVMLTSPIKRDTNASMTVNTNAGSKCTILVTYNKIIANEPALSPAAADSYGSVSWTWYVGNTVPVGMWPIKVTCVYHKSTGVATTTLQVTN